MTVRRRYVALSGGWYYSRLSDRGYQGIPGGLFARVTIPGHREGRAEAAIIWTIDTGGGTDGVPRRDAGAVRRP
jgi:hypothetical protein